MLRHPVVGLRLATPHAAVLLCTTIGRAVAHGISVSIGLHTTERVARRLGVRGNVSDGSPGDPLASPLVGRKVEADEEEEVAAENAAASDGSELLAGAPASVGHPRKVGGSEVGVGRKVDESCGTDKQPDYAPSRSGPRTKINDELQDLEAGDPLLPPNTDAARRLEVVPIHDDVDEEVDGDGDP